MRASDVSIPPVDAAAVRRIHALATTAALIAAAVGVAALASYPLELTWLRSFGHPLEVQPNTAAGIIIAALSLLARDARRRPVRFLAFVAAVAVAALGLATLAEHLTGLDLGLDRVVFPEIPRMAGTTSAGRMGPPASLSLLGAGVALALIHARVRRGDALAQAVALAVLPVPLLGLVGNFFGVSVLYDVSRASAIALPSALALVVLQLGVLCARPRSGFVANLSSTGAGSAIARRTVLYALALPPALGAAAVAFAGGPGRGALDVSLLVVALSFLFVALVLHDASTLNRMEAAKLAALRDRATSREEALRALAREQEARAQAETASRAKDEFLATLSHELRTPLNAILGWAGLLRDAAGNPERLARGLTAVERNGRALAQLVSDLLDMSRVASGKLEVAHADVDLLAVVDEAVASLAGAAAAKEIAVVRATVEVAPRVVGDPERLEQVAWNLLSNALKFTPPGGHVEVRLSQAAGEAVLEVADDGIGVKPEVLDTVFDPFVQADGSAVRRHGGLGLGLAISRALVALHGGTLEAESAGPDRGATFRVRLPAVAAHAAAGDASADDRRPDLRGARVLVVDDDGDSREILLQLLESWGASAFGAGSTREALEAAERHAPELVVSDIAMPGEDGYALIRELRRAEGANGGGHVPVVALTAFARAEDRRRALAAGFDAHLAKPVDPTELRASLSALLDRDGETPRPHAGGGEDAPAARPRTGGGADSLAAG